MDLDFAALWLWITSQSAKNLWSVFWTICERQLKDSNSVLFWHRYGTVPARIHNIR
jgi:hypothetical protein